MAYYEENKVERSQYHLGCIWDKKDRVWKWFNRENPSLDLWVDSCGKEFDSDRFWHRHIVLACKRIDSWHELTLFTGWKVISVSLRPLSKPDVERLDHGRAWIGPPGGGAGALLSAGDKMFKFELE